MSRPAPSPKIWWVLLVGFSSVLVAMLWATITASLDRSVFAAGPELWADPWAKATLFDAYFGFLAVYVWIYFRESSVAGRALWFLLVMTLGNIAIAAYFLGVLLAAPERDWRVLFPQFDGDQS